MIIEAPYEFFFVMTENLSQHHSYIYVHQTRTSLCIHRLSPDTTEDELNICAERGNLKMFEHELLKIR